MSLRDGKPDFEGISIVLIGSFNPQILQPAWFAAQGLLRKTEADAAKIEVILSEVVSFSTDWFKIIVTKDRFQLLSLQSLPYEPHRDLVLGTFRLLQHTPIRQMGLNKDAHFGFPSEEELDDFGYSLVSLKPWEGILKPHIGLLGLKMQGQRPDDFKGFVYVTVQPSAKVKPGAYVGVNDHFEVTKEEASQGCKDIIDILDKVWSASLERSNSIIQKVFRRPNAKSGT